MRARLLLFVVVNVASLVGHGLRTALSVVGVAAGTTMVAAVLILSGSLDTSYGDTITATGGGADLEVTTPASAGVPADLADRVSGIPGVRVAAPVLQQWATVRGAGGQQAVQVLGIDARFGAVAGSLAAKTRLVPARPAAGAAAPASLLAALGTRRGQSLTLLAGSAPVALPVTAQIEGAGSGVFNGRFILLPLDLAQAVLGHPGRISSVEVVATDHAAGAVANLRRSLGAAVGPGLQVVTPSSVQAQLQATTQPLLASTSFFALLTLLVGAYLVYNTAAITAVERRREAAILLVVGEGRRSLLLRTVGEAAVIGVAGVACGLVAGVLLGQRLADSVPHFIEDAYGFVAKPQVPLAVLFVAALAGLVAAVGAALLGTAAVLRLPLAEALRPDAPGEPRGGPRRRAWVPLVGLALVGGGFAGSLLAPDGGLAFALLTLAGAVLAAPAALTAAVRLAAALLVRIGARVAAGVGVLTGAALVQGPGRAARTAGTVTFALALVMAVSALTGNVGQSIDRFLAGFSFDLYVSASDSEYFTAPLDPAVVPAVAGLPGVEKVYPLRSLFVPWRSGRVWLIGDDPAEPSAVPLTYVEGSAAAAAAGYRGDGVVVSTQIARLDGVHVGDSITLDTPIGPRAFRVTGVIADWSYPQGVLAIGNDAFARDFLHPEVNELELGLRPGADPAAVRRAVERALGDRFPLVVKTAAQVRQTANDDLSATFAPLLQMRDVVAVAAVLAMFNAMLVAVLQRRREIGVLHAIGALRSELSASVVLEAFVVAQVALLAGTALGTLIHFLGVQYTVSTTGSPLSWSFQAPGVGVAAGASLLAALAGSAYPAVQAARLPVLEAIRYE